MLTLLLLLQLTIPNPTVTPGVLRPLTIQQICLVPWGKDDRKVTERMKQQVAKMYHIKWADHGKFEFDHRYPRSEGGADVIWNLWPQPWAEAYKKDRLEILLHKMVCNGQLSLRDAQLAFKGDWRVAYKRYIQEEP